MTSMDCIQSDEEDWIGSMVTAEAGMISTLPDQVDQDPLLSLGNPFRRTSKRPPRVAKAVCGSEMARKRVPGLRYGRKTTVSEGCGGVGGGLTGDGAGEAKTERKRDALVAMFGPEAGTLVCGKVEEIDEVVSNRYGRLGSTGSGSFLGREVSLGLLERGGKKTKGDATEQTAQEGDKNVCIGPGRSDTLKENMPDVVGGNEVRVARREDGSHVITLRHRASGATEVAAATPSLTARKRKASNTVQPGWGNNFVRLNMKKGGKDFARVKGGASRFKKGGKRRSSKWRAEPLRAVGDGEHYLSGWEQGSGLRCFKCGEFGHFASACASVLEDFDGSGDHVDDTGEEFGTPNSSIRAERPNTQQSMQLSSTLALPAITPPPLAPIDIPGTEELRSILKSKFGHDEFRGSQLDTIIEILGGKSCLNIMPTGMGKSLCYQLPAFLMARPVVVISPLIALMQDQCAAAPPELHAAVLWSGQTPKDALQILDNVRQGITKLLFISPERASNEIFLDAVRPWLPLQLLVIDEAHCISEWGHSFRPSYYRLGKVIRSQLPAQSILALTATATLTTEACIAQILDIPEGNTFRHKGMHPNLRLRVEAIEDYGARKWEVIAQKVLPHLKQKSCRRAILYCSFRRDADVLARALVAGGIRAKSYHSGVFVTERERILSSFAKGTLNVVVATTAFGMGINIAQVDAVYHVSMPRSLEEYVQQIGRAGRSGGVAECLCFLNKAEFLTLRSLASNPYIRLDAVKTIVDAIFPPSHRPGEYRVLDLRKILGGKIPEETIESIICYLENLETPLLHFVGQVPLKARVSFYAKQPQEMVDDDPIVATILKACPKPRQGVYHVEVAKMCTENGASPAKNFQELSAMSKRKLIGFQPSKERGLCYRIEAKSVDSVSVAREVSGWLQKMNAMIIHKLDITYKAFQVAAMTQGGPGHQEDALRSIVEHYFAEPSEDFDKFLEGVVSNCGVDGELVKSGDEGTVSAARLVLRRAKEHNIDVTPVEICGILHGIISGLDKSKGLQHIMSLFWGRLKHVDHRDVLAAAERVVEEIVNAS